MKRSKLNVTVCELHNTPSGLEDDWTALVDHAGSAGSDIVLLPEMPFNPWVAHTAHIDPAEWRRSVEAHDRWMHRLDELSPAMVIASRPVIKNGARLNEGFVWDAAGGYRPVHAKYYLPNEKGFWEASWYDRGNGEFPLVETACGKIGFLICTEIWFAAHARAYAGEGIDLLVCPRATPLSSVDKWIAGGRAAAVVSGAFCLSSNLCGESRGVSFGGAGWIVEPEEGVVEGLTSRDRPFVTTAIDLEVARNAKRTYPRYVKD